MNEFTVYCIFNDINDKVYIGQTTQPYIKRFKEHAYAHTALGEDMRKYGISHFDVIPLDQSATNLDDLLKLEQYYVDKFNSIDAGYNGCYPAKTGGRIHNPRPFAVSLSSVLYQRLVNYSNSSGLPIRRALDKAIKMYLDTVDPIDPPK